jgi:hypothetical protein
MLAGLTLQAIGLGCLALVAGQHTAYLELVPMLALSGIGSSMVFSTVAGEVMGSVEPEQIGIASGTNNALRELGCVFGVAVLATVFNRPASTARQRRSSQGSAPRCGSPSPSQPSGSR